MAELVVGRTYYYPGVFVYRLVNGLIGLIDAALALRLVLELFGASASSQFVATVYEITDRLLGPFVGAFPNFSLGSGFVIDVTAILGMIGYAILGWIIIRVFALIFNLASTR
jgi:hypothetical protein